MDAKTRDELLIRLEERSLNTWNSIEKIETHIAEQNGYIRENFIATSRNTIYRRITIGIGGSAIMALILHLIGVY